MRWDLAIPIGILVLMAGATLLLVGPGWPTMVAWWTMWMRRPPSPSTAKAYRIMGAVCAGGILAIGAFVVIYVSLK